MQALSPGVSLRQGRDTMERERRHSHYLNVTAYDLVSSVLQRDASLENPEKFKVKQSTAKTGGTHIFNVNIHPCYILLTCELQRIDS